MILIASLQTSYNKKLVITLRYDNNGERYFPVIINKLPLEVQADYNWRAMCFCSAVYQCYIFIYYFFSLSQYTLLPLNQLNTEANNTLKWLPTRQAQTIQFQTGFN